MFKLLKSIKNIFNRTTKASSDPGNGNYEITMNAVVDTWTYGEPVVRFFIRKRYIPQVITIVTYSLDFTSSRIYSQKLELQTFNPSTNMYDSSFYSHNSLEDIASVFSGLPYYAIDSLRDLAKLKSNLNQDTHNSFISLYGRTYFAVCDVYDNTLEEEKGRRAGEKREVTKRRPTRKDKGYWG